MTYPSRVYPHAPGFKERNGPSEAAARQINAQISDLHKDCLAAIRAAGNKGLTADECARAVSDLRGEVCTPFLVRPRVTELYKLGLINKSGYRRPNASGQTANIWIAIQ